MTYAEQEVAIVNRFSGLHEEINQHLVARHLPSVSSYEEIINSLSVERRSAARWAFNKEPETYIRLLRRIMAEKALTEDHKGFGNWYYAEGLMRSAREITTFYNEKKVTTRECTQRVLIDSAVSSVVGGKVASVIAEKTVGVITRFNEISGLLTNRLIRKIKGLNAEPSLEEMTATAVNGIQRRVRLQP